MSQKRKPTGENKMPLNDKISSQKPVKNKKSILKLTATPKVQVKKFNIQTDDMCQKPSNPLIGGGGRRLHKDGWLTRVTKKDLDGPLSLADQLYVDAVAPVAEYTPVPYRHCAGRMNKQQIGPIEIDLANNFKLRPSVFMPKISSKLEVIKRELKKKIPKSIPSARPSNPENGFNEYAKALAFECLDSDRELEKHVNIHFEFDEMLVAQRRDLISEDTKQSDTRIMTHTSSSDGENPHSKFNHDPFIISRTDDFTTSSDDTSVRKMVNSRACPDLQRDLKVKGTHTTVPFHHPHRVLRKAKTQNLETCQPVLPRPENGEKFKSTFDRLAKPRGIPVTKFVSSATIAKSYALSIPSPKSAVSRPGKSVKQVRFDIKSSESLQPPGTEKTLIKLQNGRWQAEKNTRRITHSQPDCLYLYNGLNLQERKSKIDTAKTFSDLEFCQETNTDAESQIASRGKFYCPNHVKAFDLLNLPVLSQKAVEKSTPKIRPPKLGQTLLQRRTTEVFSPSTYKPQQRKLKKPNEEQEQKGPVVPLESQFDFSFKKGDVDGKAMMSSEEDSDEEYHELENMDTIAEEYIPPKYSMNNPRAGIFEPVLPRLKGIIPTRFDLTFKMIEEMDCRMPVKHTLDHNCNINIEEFKRASAEFQHHIPLIPMPELFSAVELMKDSLQVMDCKENSTETFEDQNICRANTSISAGAISMDVGYRTIHGSEAEAMSDLDTYSSTSRGSIYGDGYPSYSEDEDKFRDYYDLQDGFNNQLHTQESFQSRFHPSDKFHRSFWRSQSNTSFPASELSLARSNPSATISTPTLTDIEEVDEDGLGDEEKANAPPDDMDYSLFETLQATCSAIDTAQPMSKALMTALENVENDIFNAQEWENLQVSACSILKKNNTMGRGTLELNDLWDPNSQSSASSYPGQSDKEVSESDSSNIKTSVFETKTKSLSDSTPSLKQFARILKIVEMSGMNDSTSNDLPAFYHKSKTSTDDNGEDSSKKGASHCSQS